MNKLTGIALVMFGLVAIAARPGIDHTGSLFCIVIGAMVIHSNITRK